VKSIPLKSLKSPDDINRIYNEIAVLRDLKHPNIVRLLDTFTSNDQICFVMEYCSGGELYDFIVEN
jgi:calcium-dependent protein kinase